MNEKMKICVECEQYNSTNSTCKSCGCYLPLKTKVPWTTCPLGKWEKQNLVKPVKLF